MKSLLNYVVAGWLALVATLGHAALEQAESAAEAPVETVSIVWVVVFLVLFVGVCVGIGVGIYRAERASKAIEKKA